MYKYKPILTLGQSGSFDDTSIFSMAILTDINNNPIKVNDKYYFFYTGSTNSTYPNHECSIGLCVFDNIENLERYSENPIINRNQVGLGGAGQGISVFDVKYINNKYYMFFTAIYSSTNFKIAMMESNDLYNWSNFTVVIDDYGKNHAPFVMVDPINNNNLIMYFCFIPSGSVYFRIGRAIANIQDLYTWNNDLVNNPILINASTHFIYPYMEYVDNQFHLYVTKSFIESTLTKFRIYDVWSNDDTDFNPNNISLVVDIGRVNMFDDSYVSCFRKYIIDNKCFGLYAARKSMENIYTSIGIVRE